MRIAVADVLGWRPVRPTGRFLTTFPNWPRTIFEPAWRMRPTVRGGLSLPRYEAFVRPKPHFTTSRQRYRGVLARQHHGMSRNLL